MATNYNAPGPWNSFNPVGKYTASSSAMPSGNDRAAYEKKMADVYSNVKVGTDLFGNSIKGYTGTSNNSTGVNQSRAGINAPGINSRPTGGNLSFSLGGGRGGGQYSSVPNVSLTPQTFAPWESTYTPPTPATPVPYDWATRDPYIYGDGLSNAGAAYDIWGSKPGTNPYLLSTPADYTPGILGLDPVTLPGNMPNKGANINALSNLNRNNNQVDNRTQKQKEWDRIAAYASYSKLPKQELKMASDQYAARYGNEIFNNDKAGLAKMFPETNWDNFATPELRNKNQVTSYKPLAANKTLAAKAAAPKPVAPTRQITSKMDRDYSPPSQPKKYATATYTAKKQSTAAAVKKYNNTASYKINTDPSKGRIRL